MAPAAPRETTCFVQLQRGGRVFCKIVGQETGRLPLVLFRPLGGSTDLWGRFAERLAEYRRIVMFDYLGTGRSSPRVRPWLTTKALAEEAADVVRALGLKQVDLFGISLGGMVATWFAHEHPDDVRRLCLAATPLRGTALRYQDLREKAGLAACLFRPATSVERCLARRILSPEFRRSQPDEVARIESLACDCRTSRTALLRYAAAGAAHDASAFAGRISTPALVLAGRRDTVLGEGPAGELARALPQATFLKLDGGHDLTLELPVETARFVGDFLDGEPIGEGF